MVSTSWIVPCQGLRGTSCSAVSSSLSSLHLPCPLKAPSQTKIWSNILSDIADYNRTQMAIFTYVDSLLCCPCFLFFSLFHLYSLFCDRLTINTYIHTHINYGVKNDNSKYIPENKKTLVKLKLIYAYGNINKNKVFFKTVVTPFLFLWIFWPYI